MIYITEKKGRDVINYYMDFKELTLEDKKWIDPLLKTKQYRACEYSFANLYIWGKQYNAEVANIDGFYVAKLGNKGAFSYPVGEGSPKGVIEKLIEYTKEKGQTLRLHALCEGAPAELESLFPGQFELITNRDNSDYIYYAESLITLTGKKLSAKRNHINNFLRNNPDWQFEPVTKDNIEECRELTRKWCEMNFCGDDPSKQREMRAIKLALDNFDALELKGGVIRVNGEVIAYSLGEPLTSDTFVVHIEKTFSDIQGAYTIINREFAKHFASGYTYINREEDMGIPGLRQAKLSYHPAIILDKYNAIYKN